SNQSQEHSNHKSCYAVQDTRYHRDRLQRGYRAKLNILSILWPLQCLLSLYAIANHTILEIERVPKPISFVEYDTFLERIKIVLDGDFRIPLVTIPFVNPAHALIIIRGVIPQDNLRTMTLQSCHDGLVCSMPTSPFSMIYDELETSRAIVVYRLIG